MGRTFWGLMALFAAAAAHIAFVLFGPQQLFHVFARSSDFGRKANQLVVLSDQARASMLPALRGPGAAAVCNINLAQGPVRMVVQPPKGYWTLSIYAQDGKQVYALNDAQADNEALNIDLFRAKSITEQILGKGKDDEDDDAGAIENAAWRVELGEEQGYAVLWVPLADPLLAAGTTEALKASACGPRKT